MTVSTISIMEIVDTSEFYKKLIRIDSGYFHLGNNHYSIGHYCRLRNIICDVSTGTLRRGPRSI